MWKCFFKCERPAFKILCSLIVKKNRTCVLLKPAVSWQNVGNHGYIYDSAQYFVILLYGTEVKSVSEKYLELSASSNWVSSQPFLFFEICCHLLELKLRQSEEGGLTGQGGSNPSAKTCRTNTDQKEAALTGTELQRLNNNSNTNANVEETANIITNRLKERRRELGLPDNIKVSVRQVLPTYTHSETVLLFLDKQAVFCARVCRRCHIVRWFWRRPTCRSVCCTLRVCTDDR